MISPRLLVSLSILTLATETLAQTTPPAPAPQPPAAATAPSSGVDRAARGADAPSARGSSRAREEADRHFKRGVELFGDDDFQAALIELERAYQALPNYQVLYNIGQVRFQLQDYAGALKALEKFLLDGGPAIPRERREDVEREVAKLRGRVATIEIRTEPGAVVYVDGVSVGTAPLSAPIQVSAGRRTIRAVLPSRDPAEKVLELAGADAAHVELPIDAPKRTPPATSPGLVESVAPGEAPRSRSALPWVFWGLTGALATGAAVTGTIALGASSDAKAIRDGGGRLSDYDADQRKMQTFALVTDVLGGLAIAGAVIATIVTVSGGRKTGAAEPPAHVGLRLGLSPGGASLGGAF